MSAVVPTLPLPDQEPILSSGEVGVKIVDTILVVESATRRCGIPATALSAEHLETAMLNLHFILAALSNRGVNLWAVDRQLVPLTYGKADYELPIGTEKIINIMYRTNGRLDVNALVLNGMSACTLTLKEKQEYHTLGFKVPAEYTGRLVLEYSDDGDNWTVYRDFGEVTLGAGWHWYTFDPAIESLVFRIRNSDDQPLDLDDMMLSNSVSDGDMYRMNRDTYTAIPDKTVKGKPYSFLFDKQISSRIILHPVPNDETAKVILWRQRRIQDVGSLAHKLEIPERWFEAIIWALAKNLAFELPNVQADRRADCIAQAAEALRDAELGESDQSPLFIKPNISGYTA